MLSETAVMVKIMVNVVIGIRIIRATFSLPYLMPQSQGFHFSFGSVSLMITISLFYRVFSLSVIDSELHGEINILES